MKYRIKKGILQGHSKTEKCFTVMDVKKGEIYTFEDIKETMLMLYLFNNHFSEYFEKVKEESKVKPEIGEYYLFIDDVGDICSWHWHNTNEDKKRLAIGNVYNPKTKEAQAVLDLRIDVQAQREKYGDIEMSDLAYSLHNNRPAGDKWILDHTFTEGLIDYRLSGTVMHKDSSEEEREERLEILKRNVS